MLAAAQTTGEFVSASGIEGVTDVRTMPDGSAQLTMSNGTTISVPAADVQIATNGQVLVSDRIIDIAAEVMAGGAGGVGGGAIAAGLAGGAGLAAAAGGGGSDGGDGPPALPVLNGEDFQSTVLGVSGGFNNGNTGIGLPEGTSSVEVTITDEDGEETTVPAQLDEEGNWTTPEADNLPQGNVTVTVTSFDADGEEIGSTSQEFNVDTVPPTITIDDTGAGEDGVLNLTEQGEGITLSGSTDAEDGQTVTVMVGTEEFTTTASGGAWSVVVPAGSLATIEDGATVEITANVADAAGNEAVEATDSFGTDLSAAITIETIAGDPVAAADITAADRVGGFDVTGSVTGVEDGQTVTVTLNGTDFTAQVAGGEFTVPISAGFLNGLDAGPVTLNVSASVTDVAGNTATDTPAPIAADFTGPSIAIDPIPTTSGDDTLNIEERANGFEVSGTTDRVAQGSTVTVTVNGEELTGPVTVDANGDWSVTVASGDGGTFPQNGPVTITAEVTDSDSGIPASAVPLDLNVDLQAPTIEITDTGTGDDGILNLTEQGEGVTISGTTDAEDGQEVTVRLFDGPTQIPGGGGTEYTATASGGNWSVDIPAATLAQFVGDGTVRVTADVSDLAGNPAETTEQSFGRDLTAPTISFNDISGDNQIGLLDVQGDLLISGSTNAEIGRPVTLTFDGQTFTGEVIGNSLGGAEPNSWSVIVPQSAIQAIQTEANTGDGTLSDIPVTATVTDAAGNPADAPATTTVDADFNGPSITIDDISGDNLVNAAEAGEDIILSGTTNNVPDSEDVTLNVGSLGPLTVGIVGGVWQTSLTPAQATTAGLTDGATVDITADVTDGDGVPAPQATAEITADFTAPTIAINTVSDDDIINIDDSTESLIISGTTTGVEAGQSVSVNVEGLGGESAEVGADGTWSVGFTPTLTEQWVTDEGNGATPAITANVTDLAGNPAPEASRPVTIDVSAPTVSINPLPLGMDDVMNLAEQGTDLVITGTATDTTEVTVTFNGTALAPVAVTGGNWTLTIPSADLTGLADGATIAVQADVTDSSDNTAQDTASFGTDFTAPTITITDTGVGPDDILNIAESEAGITVTGNVTGADGQTVAVTLSGAAATPIVGTGTVTGGTFAVEFTSGDLSSIGSWPSATVTAEVSDAAGNPATPATDSFDIDLTAPTIAFDDPPPADFVLGIEERDSLETEGVAVTTTEPDGTPVTLTFTRPDGSGGTVTDVTINTTVSNGGTFDIPLTAAQIATLEDETTYTLDLTITDDAGNTGSDQIDVPTDFVPILTIDEVGVDGAVDLSDTEDASITGTTLGVEEGRPVTVTVTGSTSGQVLNTTAAVGAGGIWTLPIDPTFFDELEAGETFTVSASVSNDAGRAANAEQADIDAYLASLYAIVNTAESGATLTMSAIAGEGLDTDAGITTTMSFDPARATYINGSDDDNLDLFIANTANAATGSVLFSGGTASGSLADGDVLYTFDMTDQGTGPITLSFVEESQGGPTELQIGTAGGDTLTASNTDSVIQAKGGDDSIDVSESGTNIVVFELDQASNGTDTVTGFTTGDTFQSDVIAFLGEADLRGDGDFVQSMTDGQAIGVNTGFVIFTTALADTNAATLETAFEGLLDETAGDVVYFLAGDGTNAALARVDVTAPDDASVEILANFSDIGDLSQLNADNVILPDPAGIT
ncbi:MAG: hypothetical protein RID11_20125 [Roseovarius sp.]|uniref:beta strand repeat-containing protein n=1 Tax=Roseovarius sp. TaxID=1486281 RepID=UPI0032EEC4E0